MANVLLTGTRAPAALELARVFSRAGHRVIAAESFRAQLSAPSRALARSYLVPPPRQQTDEFLQALERIIKAEAIDLRVPTCEEVFHVARGRAWLSTTVFCEPIERLRELHNKFLFNGLADRLGLCTPDARLVKSEDDLVATFSELGSLVLKPLYSRFASKALIRPDIREARRALQRGPRVEWIAQRYVGGQELCTYSVCHVGRVTAHAAYPARFTAGQGATVLFEPIEHAGALAWVRQLVGAISFTGQIALDFIESQDGTLFALECNPRATSGAHLLAAEPAFANAFFDASQPILVPSADTRPAMLGTAMLMYGLPQSLRRHGFIKWLRAFKAARDVVFDPHDPWPAILQLRSIVHYLRLARQRGISALQASTYDIEWNGE